MNPALVGGVPIKQYPPSHPYEVKLYFITWDIGPVYKKLEYFLICRNQQMLGIIWKKVGTYTELITQALKNQKALTVSGIYNWIV